MAITLISILICMNTSTYKYTHYKTNKQTQITKSTRDNIRVLVGSGQTINFDINLDSSYLDTNRRIVTYQNKRRKPNRTNLTLIAVHSHSNRYKSPYKLFGSNAGNLRTKSGSLSICMYSHFEIFL